LAVTAVPPGTSRGNGAPHIPPTHPRSPHPPSGPSIFLVSFDISFDARRRQAGKLLERHGPKVLRSAYEIQAGPRLNGLVARLGDLLEPHDHALVLPVCDRCRQAWWGGPVDAVPAHGWVAR
jgi:CRISPR-associated endonuclease Cas2